MKGNRYFVDTKAVKQEFVQIQKRIIDSIADLDDGQRIILNKILNKALEHIKSQVKLYQLPSGKPQEIKSNKTHYHDYIQGFCDAVTVINNHLNKVGGGVII